jgi:hypothetical protein
MVRGKALSVDLRRALSLCEGTTKLLRRPVKRRESQLVDKLLFEILAQHTLAHVWVGAPIQRPFLLYLMVPFSSWACASH